MDLLLWILLGITLFLMGVFLLSVISRMLRNETEKVVSKPVSRFSNNEYVYFSQISRSKNPSGREQILDQLNYPISSRDLVRYAQERPTDSYNLILLTNLPDHIYRNKSEILNQIKNSR